MAGDLEQKGLGRAHGLGRPGLPEAEVGLLHDVVDIAHGREIPAEPGLELAVVGMHLLLEPVRQTLRGCRLLHRGSDARRRRYGRRRVETALWLGVAHGGDEVREHRLRQISRVSNFLTKVPAITAFRLKGADPVNHECTRIGTNYPNLIPPLPPVDRFVFWSPIRAFSCPFVPARRSLGEGGVKNPWFGLIDQNGLPHPGTAVVPPGW